MGRQCALAVASLLTLIACSDDGQLRDSSVDASSPDGSSPPSMDAPLDWQETPRLAQAREAFDGMAKRLAAAGCERMRFCRPDLFEAIFPTAEVCEASGADWYTVGGWAEAYARGNVEVDFDQLDTCIADLARACDLAAAEAAFGCIHAAFEGPLGRNARCLFDVECGPDLYCDADICDGICQPQRQPGEACETSSECKDPFGCDSSILATDEDDGLPSDGSDGGVSICRLDAFDLASYPVPGRQRDSCGWLNPCAPGLACPDDVCVPALEVNAACALPNDSSFLSFGSEDPCGRGHDCFVGVCAARVTEAGASCDDARCARGLRCQSHAGGHVCTLLHPWGSACTRDADCASDACLEGHCRQPWSSPAPPTLYPGASSRCGAPVAGAR